MTSKCLICETDTAQEFNIRFKKKAVCMGCEKAIVKQSIAWRYE